MGTRMRAVRSIFATILISLSLLPSSGCSKRDNLADTHVARAELFRTDSARYDQFFEDVNGLQKDAAAASDDEKKATSPLLESMGLADTPVDTLLGIVADHLKKLAKSKPKMVIGLEGLDESGKPVLGQVVRVTPPQAKRKTWSKDGRAFADALDATLQGEAKILDRCAPVADKARRRLELLEALKREVEKEFAAQKSDKQREIRRELDASTMALNQSAETCTRVGQSVASVFDRVSRAVASSAESSPKPQKPNGSATKGEKPASGTKPKASPPAGTKRADDFDP